jgi:hypothetical protein
VGGGFIVSDFITGKDTMKRFRSIMTVVLTGGLLAVAAACGSSGATGPAGATGPQGAQGPQGPEGNANVQVDTFTLTNSQWLWNSQYALETSPGSYTEYFTRYYNAPFSAVTSDILTEGMVLVYFTPSPITNAVQWEPLPYQFTDGAGSFTYNVVYETMVDTVRLHYFFVTVNNENPTPTLSSYDIPTYQFKILAVSGSIASGLTSAHVDLADYAAVSRFIARASGQASGQAAAQTPAQVRRSERIGLGS